MDGKGYAHVVWGISLKGINRWDGFERKIWNTIARRVSQRIEKSLQKFSSLDDVAGFLNSCGGDSAFGSYKNYAGDVPSLYEKAARRYIQYLKNKGQLTREFK